MLQLVWDNSIKEHMDTYKAKTESLYYWLSAVWGTCPNPAAPSFPVLYLLWTIPHPGWHTSVSHNYQQKSKKQGLPAVPGNASQSQLSIPPFLFVFLSFSLLPSPSFILSHPSPQLSVESPYIFQADLELLGSNYLPQTTKELGPQTIPLCLA